MAIKNRRGELPRPNPAHSHPVGEYLVRAGLFTDEVATYFEPAGNGILIGKYAFVVVTIDTKGTQHVVEFVDMIVEGVRTTAEMAGKFCGSAGVFATDFCIHFTKYRKS